MIHRFSHWISQLKPQKWLGRRYFPVISICCPSAFNHLLHQLQLVFLFCLLLLVCSCKSTKQVSQIRQEQEQDKTEQLESMISDLESEHQLFTGFIIENLETGKVLHAHNEDKFFTPASNTKLLTYLAATEILGDSIPALKYIQQGDSLFIFGTGDPSFLAPYDADSTVYNFLSNAKQTIYVHTDHLKTARFGAGWAWDDFKYYYQKENSALPFLNMATQIKTHPDSSSFGIEPAFMKDYIKTDLQAPSFINRGEQSNSIVINPLHKPSYARDYEVPFYITPEFMAQSLSQTLDQEVVYSDLQLEVDSAQTLYHNATDSLMKQLILYSDNFVAEQLVFLMSNPLDVDMSTRVVIRKILDSIFKDIPDRPRWVDGSGLSRYNLITPRSINWVLKRLNESISQDDVEAVFPSGDHSDTLPKAFESISIRAKTGTLSNNFCLSGFLTADSGQQYVFSWMNNHHMISKTELTERMAEVLAFVEKNW